MSSDDEVHSAAQRGFAQAAEAYERGRPDYPEPIRGWLSTSLALRPGTTALDLGAGTGKFTRILRQTGASVVAVEPVAGMLTQLIAGLPGVMALAATAQKLWDGRPHSKRHRCAKVEMLVTT